MRVRAGSAGHGALLGGLAAIGLLGWLYLGHGWLGVPFVPFDISDAIIRLTPGAIATAGIEAFCEGAKRILLAVGILTFVGTAALVAALSAGLSFRRATRVLFLTTSALLITALNESVIAWNRAPLPASALWLALSYALWAWAVAAAGAFPVARHTTLRSQTAGGKPAGVAFAAPPVPGAPASPYTTNRRSFIARFAAATVGMALAGTVLGELGRSARAEQSAAFAPLPTTTPPPLAPVADAPRPAIPGLTQTAAAAPVTETQAAAPATGATPAAAPATGATSAAGATSTGATTAAGATTPAAAPTLAPAAATSQPAPVIPLPTPGTPLPAFAAAIGTRPALTPLPDFYVVNIATRDPLTDLSQWRLTIKGQVERSLVFTYQDLLRYPRVDVTATLECISNPLAGSLISTAQFNGLRLVDLLSQAKPRHEVVEMVTRSLDGYTESIPIDKALRNDTLLIYGMDGLVLGQEHGYPLRLYNPNHYGMKNPKWLIELELVGDPYVGYWEDRGWDKDAVVKTTSVVDTRGELYRGRAVQFGGIAFAGWRSIQSVDVNIDNRGWEAAVLEPPPSIFTWVRWRYDWNAPMPGPHEVLVRAVDGTGEEQTSFIAPPHPDGASGWHKVRVIVK